METIVNELKEIFTFKNTTEVGDIVLVLTEEPQSVLYAYITKIIRDQNPSRDNWWHITMHILTLPPQKTVWILRVPQFTGMEIFSMGGDRRFMKALDFSGHDDLDKTLKKESKKGTPMLKVVKRNVRG